MLRRITGSGGRLSLAIALLMAGTASGATSFSNSLTGFTGDSSQPATQAALSAAGFNLFANDGDGTVTFDSSGASFGLFAPGDAGRNYMRTNDSDYATTTFVAEVTMVTADQESQDGFFGIGAGDVALFGWPDWSTQFSSLILTPEVNSGDGLFTTMHTHNDTPIFTNTPIPALASGTHRLRLSIFADVATYSIDLNYAGGAFTADFTAPDINVGRLFASDGWPSEPSRIFFGGDDATIFKDFQATVSGPRIQFGDFNNDGAVNSADWVIFRTNQETNLSGLSIQDAYFRGDLNRDLANNEQDFVLFKTSFDEANGVGAFVAMLAAVPEPSGLALIALGLLPLVRRTRRRQ
jgi:hypothetical protein